MSTSGQRKLAARVGSHLRSRILSGIVVLVPLIATIMVLHLLFVTLSVFLQPILFRVLPGWPGYALRALATLATVLIVYAVGVVATMVVGRQLLKGVDDLFRKMPVIGAVYTAAKQIMDTIRSGGGRTSFKAVVRVPFPNAECQSLAFVTGSHTRPDGEVEYRVFMPTTPNPTSGFMLIVPASRVEMTTMSVEEGIKLIISGGVLGFDNGRARGTPAAGAAVSAPPAGSREQASGGQPNANR